MPLFLLLAALAAEAPKTVSPVVVTGAPILAAEVRLDGKDEASRAIIDAWPSAAFSSTQDGRVVLNCRVDRHGLAEFCEVVSEFPKGAGFAKLALQMRILLKLPPPRGPDGPTTAMMHVAVTFKASHERINSEQSRVDGQPNNGGVQSPIAPSAPVAEWNDPVWLRAPSFEDLATAYPRGGRGEEGYVVFHCRAASSGGLYDCTILKETPVGHGFGRAALKLKPLFRLDMGRAPGLPVGQALRVDIPIRLPPPGGANHVVEAPLWISGFDPKAAIKLYPPEAVAQGVKTGLGVVRCQIARDGAVEMCAPLRDEPAGFGFSEVAAKVAMTLKASLWSLDAAPVAEGQIDVPIRLNERPPSN